MSVSLGALELSGPVLVAAGCGGTGRELEPYVDLATLGAFVTRSISLDPRSGAEAPRVVETPSGLLHAEPPSPGLEPFLASELPWLVRSGARVVVSITGRSLGEHTEIARRLGRAPGPAAVEVAVSGEPFHAASLVAAVVRDLPRGLPVLAKLRPDLLRVVETARGVLDAGAAAVVVGDAQAAALPDGRPAGLSGPAIRPVALRCVTEVCAALPDAAVIGGGGIATTADARSFLAAGARAVQVGTALLHDPTTAARIAAELDQETP
ncbi:MULTISPECIES: HisA/HisF-related TIM barrel protein [unclassified Nocardioides]|uniref:HisA/HisF-related TIM barrel protein n=1 Tax=unclassified Nocardioides TaxID=2615069 RepID=UPI00301581F0